MTSLTAHVNEGFDRLQALLLAMHIGDEVRPSEIASATGLTETTCRTVLVGLERAGLMVQQPDGRFVRRSLDIVGS